MRYLLIPLVISCNSLKDYFQQQNYQNRFLIQLFFYFLKKSNLMSLDCLLFVIVLSNSTMRNFK